MPLCSNLSAMTIFTRARPSYEMHEKAVAKLGLEPGGLGRHDAAAVGDGHQIVDGHGVHRKCHRGVAGVDGPHERVRSARAADKVDALVRPDVADVEQVLEHAALQPRHVEAAAA